jgi:hypothetical protein
VKRRAMEAKAHGPSSNLDYDGGLVMTTPPHRSSLGQPMPVAVHSAALHNSMEKLHPIGHFHRDAKPAEPSERLLLQNAASLGRPNWPSLWSRVCIDGMLNRRL